jgi:hypothetical protein
MPNLRILSSDVVSKTGTTISATSTASGMSTNSLFNNTKNDVHRSVAGVYTQTFLIVFAAVESLGCVHGPWTNLLPSDTMQVLYSDAGATAQTFNSTVSCCPAPVIALEGWTPLQAQSAYQYGGGAHAFMWFTNQNARAMRVTFTSTANPQGFVEVSRLMAGPWVSPFDNMAYGLELGYDDQDEQYRTESTDLITDVGGSFRTLSLTWESMPEADRKLMVNFIRANGRRTPLVISGFPADADASKERDYMMVCKLVEKPGMSSPSFARFSTGLKFASI